MSINTENSVQVIPVIVNEDDGQYKKDRTVHNDKALQFQKFVMVQKAQKVAYQKEQQQTDFFPHTLSAPSPKKCGDNPAFQKTCSIIENKMLKKYPKIAEIQESGALTAQIVSSMERLTAWQDQASEFPILDNTTPFPLIVKSRTEAYLTATRRSQSEGAFKQFFITINVSDQKVKAKAKLVIIDAEQFETRKSFQTNPFLAEDQFYSKYVVCKNDFELKVGNQIILIKDLFDGDILQESQKRNWDFDQKLDVMKQALMGVRDLHNKGYIHRDIKPINFFVKTKINKKDGSEVRHVVLGDEDGVVKTTDVNRIQKFPVFTFGYTAKDGISKASSASDMYAFGASLKQMFPELNRCKEPEFSPPLGIAEAVIPKELDHREIALSKVIENLLNNNDPANRHTANEALTHLNAI